MLENLVTSFSSNDDTNSIAHITRVKPTRECFKGDTNYLEHQTVTLNPHKSMRADEISTRELNEANHSGRLLANFLKFC